MVSGLYHSPTNHARGRLLLLQCVLLEFFFGMYRLRSIPNVSAFQIVPFLSAQIASPAFGLAWAEIGGALKSYGTNAVTLPSFALPMRKPLM